MKGALPQSAQTSHTQLAHALAQYLGVESPADLEKYDIRSAGDLVDLISKVSSSNAQFGLEAHDLFLKVFNKHPYSHNLRPDADRARSLTAIVVVQPLMRAKRRNRVPRIAERGQGLAFNATCMHS